MRYLCRYLLFACACLVGVCRTNTASASRCEVITPAALSTTRSMPALVNKYTGEFVRSCISTSGRHYYLLVGRTEVIDGVCRSRERQIFVGQSNAVAEWRDVPPPGTAGVPDSFESTNMAPRLGKQCPDQRDARYVSTN